MLKPTVFVSVGWHHLAPMNPAFGFGFLHWACTDLRVLRCLRNGRLCTGIPRAVLLVVADVICVTLW